MKMLLQECLGEQDSVQQSLQQLQILGEQLKSQVDASSSAALQSDHLSFTHRLAILEHALHRQQEVLQVGSGVHEQNDIQSTTWTLFSLSFVVFLTLTIWLFVVWISDLWGFQRAVGHTNSSGWGGWGGAEGVWPSWLTRAQCGSDTYGKTEGTKKPSHPVLCNQMFSLLALVAGLEMFLLTVFDVFSGPSAEAE